MSQINVDIEKEKLGFMRRRADAIQDTVINFSGSVIKARPFHRATTSGLVIMFLGFGTALMTTLLPGFTFSDNMSIIMFALGGLLFILGIIGDVWLKTRLVEKLLTSESLATEDVVRQQKLVDDLISGPNSDLQLKSK